GGVVAEEIRPVLPLVEKLGQVFTGLAGGLAASLTVEVRGEIAAFDVNVLRLAALRGVFAPVVHEPVSYVNAPILAAERGLDVELTTSPDSPDYRNLITLRGAMADGTAVSVSGTLSGPRMLEKITELDGFDVEIPPTAHLVALHYRDRPGVVGTVGAKFGGADINIAAAQVSRTEQGGDALIVVTVDSQVDAALLDELAEAIGASVARTIDIAQD
ncbi:MAG TPA: ACT domain-containing protein, partial [Mycobacteriales bacterium]|nr:ACT domain-containing protein [Mycobacteriales bacterium]